MRRIVVPGQPESALSVAPGTRWEQVEMFFVDGTTLAVRTPGASMRRVTPHDLGLAHPRTREPTKGWTVLVALCEENGSMSWQGSVQEFNAFKALISELRRRLQAAFGIPDDPFIKCSRKEGLRARFRPRYFLPSDEPERRASLP